MTGNRVRQKAEEYKRNLFYQLPKYLIHDPEFKGLSATSKIAYSLLLDRHRLSVKNNRVDKDGFIYLIMSRVELQLLVGVSKNVATRIMDELKRFRLLEEKRRGQGKPNLIYMLIPENPVIKAPDEDFRIPLYEGEESPLGGAYNPPNGGLTVPHEGFASLSNKNELNKTEVSHIKSNKKADADATQTDKHKNEFVLFPSTVANYETTKAEIHENIDYESFGANEKEFVDNLVETMLDVICTDQPTVTINGEDKNRTIVRKIYLSLNHDHITHVMNQYTAQKHEIKNKVAYLRTMLYTTVQEIEAHYKNKVTADMYVAVKA